MITSPEKRGRAVD